MQYARTVFFGMDNLGGMLAAVLSFNFVEPSGRARDSYCQTARLMVKQRGVVDTTIVMVLILGM